MRVVQLSDLHLSGRRPFFHFNFELALADIVANPPDLVVVSGDLALDGAGDGAVGEADLAFARAQLDRLPVPWVAVPGNHDVGLSPPGPKVSQPVDEARLERYRSIVGDDRFARDIGAWRLIGLDSQLMGSGLAAEEEQWRWLDAELAGAAGRPVLIFLHVPPFIETPIEGEEAYGCLYPAPRRRLLAAIRSHGGVKAVSSGHLHCVKSMIVDGVVYQWCPATSFVITDPSFGAVGGKPITGYLEWLFDGEEVGVRLIEPPLMLDIDVRRWVQGPGSYSKAADSAVPVVPSLP